MRSRLLLPTRYVDGAGWLCGHGCRRERLPCASISSTSIQALSRAPKDKLSGKSQSRSTVCVPHLRGLVDRIRPCRI